MIAFHARNYVPYLIVHNVRTYACGNTEILTIEVSNRFSLIFAKRISLVNSYKPPEISRKFLTRHCHEITHGWTTFCKVVACSMESNFEGKRELPSRRFA